MYLTPQELQELRDSFYPKPQAATLTIPVTDKVARGAIANPNTVRISVRGEDGVTVVTGPRDKVAVTWR